MMMAARHFALQRDLIQSRRPSDGKKKNVWVDSQPGINALVERLHTERSESDSSSCLTSIKIIQPSADQSQSPLRCLALFRALRHYKTVQSLSLIGVRLDNDEATKRALEDAILSSTNLTHLQISHIAIQDGSPLMERVLGKSRSITDLRLSLREDESHASDEEPTRKLLGALAKSNLQTVHLYGLNLNRLQNPKVLVDVVQSAQLRELKLVRCNLVETKVLCHAASSSSTLQVLDLSMNLIGDIDDLAPLLESCSLTELSLSQCGLQGDGSRFCDNVASNSSLKRLDLAVNPLSEAFGEHLLRVLRQKNTTLLRLTVMVVADNSKSPTNSPKRKQEKLLSRAKVDQLRHAAALNKAGRGWLQSTTKALPVLLARLPREPGLAYGLLHEKPLE